MTKAGYVLMAVGLATGLIVRLAQPQAEGGYAFAGLMLLAGSLLLVVSGIIRVLNGQIRLRPIDAHQKAIVLFLILLGVRALIWAVFPSLERDLNEAILWSAAFAVAFGLYTTAYRKPA